MTLYRVCKICVDLLPVKTLFARCELPGRVTWGSVGGVPLSQLPCGPANRERLITLKHHPQPSCGQVWRIRPRRHSSVVGQSPEYYHHHHHHLQPKLWRLRPTTRPREDTHQHSVVQSSPARLVDVLILFGFFERFLSDPAGAFSLFVRSHTDILNIW